MNRVLLAALLLALPAFLTPSQAGAAPAQKKPFPVTIVDDHGNHIKLTRKPSRIVTLDPRDTETAFALGLEKRLVGDGGKFVEGASSATDASGNPRAFRYPSEWPSKLGRDYPVRSKDLTHVEGGCCGTPFNLETLESLRPDLVIGPYSKTELPTFQKMRDLGMQVMILDPTSINGIMHDITLVGKASGTGGQASTLVKTLRGQISGLKKRLKGAKRHPRVYYEIDATNPSQPFTAGPGTFIDRSIAMAGGKNVADGVTSCSGTLCFPQFGLEALVKLNPQIIVLGDAAYGTTPESVKSRSGWSTMSAVQSSKIFAFDDDLISRAGPRIAIGVKRLARLIHPEVFKKES